MKNNESKISKFRINSSLVLKGNDYFKDYKNDYNYYNKNIIKMNKQRQKMLSDKTLEKKERNDNLKMPKMLYSAIVLHNFNNQEPLRNKYIKKEMSNKNLSNHKERMKNLNFFDDLFDTIDNLEIETSDVVKNEDSLMDNNLNNITPIINNVNNSNNESRSRGQSSIERSRGQSGREHSGKERNFTDINENDLSKSDKKQANTMPFITNLINNINNSNNLSSLLNNSQSKNQLSIITELTNTEELNHMNSLDNPNFKQVLKFNDYGKYKFTKDGLYYPQVVPKDELPEFTGLDSSDLSYFNYKKKIHNPKKIYNPINSFDLKLNSELKRISNFYGGEKGKSRFTENPNLRIGKSLNINYDRYKDIKSIENRYADNKNYKFKLLPLINRRRKAFDLLGERILGSLRNNSQNKTIN